MHQAAVFEADVDKRPKINDVENRSLKLHARLQVLELENTFLEYRWRQVVAGIAARTRERFENVFERGKTDFQSFSDLFG
jgi:hypothetical protein